MQGLAEEHANQIADTLLRSGRLDQHALGLFAQCATALRLDAGDWVSYQHRVSPAWFKAAASFRCPPCCDLVSMVLQLLLKVRTCVCCQIHLHSLLLAFSLGVLRVVQGAASICSLCEYRRAARCPISQQICLVAA